jgi:hypothetical protein
MNTKKICILVVALLLSSSTVALPRSRTGVSAPTQTESISTEALINDIAESLDKLVAIQTYTAAVAEILDKLAALHTCPADGAGAAGAAVDTSNSTQAIKSLDNIADTIAAWSGYEKINIFLEIIFLVATFVWWYTSASTPVIIQDLKAIQTSTATIATAATKTSTSTTKIATSMAELVEAAKAIKTSTAELVEAAKAIQTSTATTATATTKIATSTAELVTAAGDAAAAATKTSTSTAKIATSMAALVVILTPAAVDADVAGVAPEVDENDDGKEEIWNDD